VRRLSLISLVLVAACSAGDDVPLPMLTSIVPNHGPVGAIVTLGGAYFCQKANIGEDPTCDTIGTVRFGTMQGTISTWNDQQIMVEVPAGSGQVDVTVIAAGRVSNGVGFTIE
jgi:hypothetical protein